MVFSPWKQVCRLRLPWLLALKNIYFPPPLLPLNLNRRNQTQPQMPNSKYRIPNQGQIYTRGLIHEQPTAPLEENSALLAGCGVEF